MNLSDLLACVVVDDSGAELGRVRDVRLVRDGPILGTFGVSLRLSELVVGIGGLGARLGYGRGDVERPALLRALFGWLAGMGGWSTGRTWLRSTRGASVCAPGRAPPADAREGHRAVARLSQPTRTPGETIGRWDGSEPSMWAA
jgi:hypothetical protein